MQAVLFITHLSPITRKPVFVVCDHVRLKPACSATETSYNLKILDLAIIGVILSRQQTTKALIRLRRLICAFVVSIYHKAGFLMMWLILYHCNSSIWWNGFLFSRRETVIEDLQSVKPGKKYLSRLFSAVRFQWQIYQPIKLSVWLKGTFANEPEQDKTNKMICALKEDSDQPGHPPGLIRHRCVL